MVDVRNERHYSNAVENVYTSSIEDKPYYNKYFGIFFHGHSVQARTQQSGDAYV